MINKHAAACIPGKACGKPQKSLLNIVLPFVVFLVFKKQAINRSASLILCNNNSLKRQGISFPPKAFNITGI